MLRSPATPSHRYTAVLLLVLMATLMAAYALWRFGGLWGETDTYVFTLATESIRSSGHLVPVSNDPLYPNGYGYQALLTFLSTVTGIPVSLWQRIAAPLMMVWVVLPAWLCYREMTGQKRGATLATIFLFIQPDFLFPLLRGTHEKFSRGLMLLGLYLLFRSLRTRKRAVSFAGLVFAFYLVMYALISFNNLLAISFITAVALSLGLMWSIGRYDGAAQITFQALTERLLSITVVLLGIGFVFTFYLYQPAQHDILVLQTLAERLALLFLDVEHATNPYATVEQGWLNLGVYFTLSLSGWLLLVASLGVWARQTWQWWRGSSPERPYGELLWAFYTAFAILTGISIAVDLSGALGSNLQHRFFPSVVMLAAPLVAKEIIAWRRTAPTTARWRTPLFSGAIAVVGCLALLKATNEPLVSNKWLFYSPAEARAIMWADRALAGRSLWTEFDERLVVGMGIRDSISRRPVRLEYRTLAPDTVNLLISDITRTRSLRVQTAIPMQGDMLITYDNGPTQIYHKRPLTVYQP